MSYTEKIDFRISNELSGLLDDLTESYDDKNATRSKLVDIGLTIIFGTDDGMEKMQEIVDNINFKGKKSRKAFTIKNKIVIDSLDEFGMFEKSKIVEYAIYFIYTRLVTAEDFKAVMVDYYMCGGALL